MTSQKLRGSGKHLDSLVDARLKRLYRIRVPGLASDNFRSDFQDFVPADSTQSTRSRISCTFFHRRSIPLADTNLWHIRRPRTILKLSRSTLSPPVFHSKFFAKTQTQKVVNNTNFWKIQSCSDRLEALGCSEKFQLFRGSGGQVQLSICQRVFNSMVRTVTKTFLASWESSGDHNLKVPKSEPPPKKASRRKT